MKNLLLLILVFFCVLNISCTAQESNKHNRTFYEEEKENFGTRITSHFPNVLTDSTRIKRNERTEFNDISFFLYEYSVSNEQLDSALALLDIYKPIAAYKSSDTCLLIVHRFETKEMYEQDIAPEITDSSLINRDCYTNLLPIPNFIDGGGSIETSCGLDSSFTIYVLEAKQEKPFPQYDLKPFNQMPSKWSNGYSRGIAISKENKIVIYWSIVW